MFTQDTDKRKINLGIGAYRDNDGKPYPLKVVRKVEKLLANDDSLNHEYLPIAGHDGFRQAAQVLLLGANSSAIKNKKALTLQALSGTGALSLGGDFIAKFFKGTPVYIPDVTWPNHNMIFARGSPVKSYRYYDPKTRGLNFNGMLEDLKAAPERSVILLHACAQNPTGVDPTKDQWKQIAEVCATKNHLPFFDIAYQGYATGDLDYDAFSVRYFVEQGFELLVAQSFAKNFGLYDQRIGAFHVVASDSSKVAAVQSQLEILVRGTYSNPPSQGARIVYGILSNPQLNAEWKQELKEMADRINQTRSMLVDELKRLNTPGDWSHITSQIGMFSYTGLNPAQCKALLEKHHVYLLASGRISMAGINTKNVGYLARCINEVVTKPL